MERIELAGGRTLEYLVEGPAGALPLVLHHGTPGGAVRQAPIFDAVTGRGLRILQYSRPGYGGSSSHPGRLVADAAADVVTLLDTIGADEFVTAGWSGGGPHALACAALLPGRCLAAATISGVAPHAAEGLDWLAGMGDENLAEFGAAAAGPAALTTYFYQSVPLDCSVSSCDSNHECRSVGSRQRCCSTARRLFSALQNHK